jgi:lipopolysaccharide transport protein LptA|tara:strand:- start:11 stop:646 length:636 start_codon:yes stop_codon:yes gene_type:complete
MLLKKNYLLFLLLIFIILIDKNVFAAPLCFEEEDSVENKKFTINENSLEKNNDSNRNNDLEKTNNKNKDEERKDIEISADNKIEVDNEQGVMIVTGNAYVKEGLTSLQADVLTAFTCETKKGETRIIQINADNNVVIISDQGKAFAERGIYFVESNIIELYDKVKLEKERDILIGDKGIFNVSTGKGEISIEPNKEGGRKKVYGIIRSKKK